MASMNGPDLRTAGVAHTGALDGWLFGRRRTWGVFGLFALLMVFDFADRMLIAALLPAIRLDWHITDAQAGLLNSALTLGMIVFAFPVALAIDRWSRVKTAALMGGVWSVAGVLGGAAASFGSLLVARAVVGIGEAGYAPAAYSWIAAAFPRRHLQLALGLFSAGAPVGMALGVAGSGYIAQHYGWRHAFGVVALPGLIVAALLYFGADFRSRDLLANAARAACADSRDKGGAIHAMASVPSRWRILGVPSLLFSFFMSGMTMMQSVPVFYFLPTWLNRIHHLPLQKASLLTSALMLLPVIGTPLGGWIMDRMTQRFRRAKLVYVAAAAAFCTVLNLAIFHFVDGWQAQYGLLAISIFVGSTAVTGPMSMTQELVHPRGRAFSATCGVIASAALGSMPGPWITGLLSDHFGLGRALTLVTFVSGVLMVCAALLALRFYLRDLRDSTSAHGHTLTLATA
jgi:predicted MFS family arabinose efflux permease